MPISKESKDGGWLAAILKKTSGGQNIKHIPTMLTIFCRNQLRRNLENKETSRKEPVGPKCIANWVSSFLPFK
jgi:hypothetical protein